CYILISEYMINMVIQMDTNSMFLCATCMQDHKLWTYLNFIFLSILFLKIFIPDMFGKTALPIFFYLFDIINIST
ncbi:hypothetical protein ACJX0J_039600, partial [Zea mays]